jgi:TPR repeat protein
MLGGWAVNQFRLARLIRRMQVMTSEKWIRLNAKAQAGDSEAQWEVGSWLEDGLADPNGRVIAHRDTYAAVRWFRQSAIAGNPSGQNHLGVCLCAGRGVRRNDTEALRWFKRALRKGYPCAANNIASVYADRKNNRRAIFWYQRAAACGDGDALVEMGRRYYAGVGIRRDPEHAVRCFHKAIKSNNISQAGREDAMYHLGVAFYDGRGVRKSNARAVEWLSRANKDDDHAEARNLIERIAKESRLGCQSL